MKRKQVNTLIAICLWSELSPNHPEANLVITPTRAKKENRLIPVIAIHVLKTDRAYGAILRSKFLAILTEFIHLIIKPHRGKLSVEVQALIEMQAP